MVSGQCIVQVFPGDHRTFIENNADQIVSFIHEKLL